MLLSVRRISFSLRVFLFSLWRRDGLPLESKLSKEVFELISKSLVLVNFFRGVLLGLLKLSGFLLLLFLEIELFFLLLLFNLFSGFLFLLLRLFGSLSRL